jgi:uroporphyrinogen decarboxylase
MVAALDHLPKPEPNVSNLQRVLRREQTNRVPLFELAIAEEVLAELYGGPLAPWPQDGDPAQRQVWAAQRVMLWRRLGYDYYRLRVNIPFSTSPLIADDTARVEQGQRAWTNERHGVLTSLDDVERYDWPRPEMIDFAQAEATLAALPEGMGAIGFSGGVLEWASTLLGLETLMLSIYDNPPLVRAVVDHVGSIILNAFEAFCQMDDVFALWMGDDMGFKTATLLRPEHLRAYILPWHKKYAELAHRTGRLFLLHSCGHVEAIMPDLIDEVRIDAKHSFEDVIVPVETFYHRWGRKVAVLGGVDVDLLSRQSPQDVRKRTEQILQACAPHGGYACGSGNSITNYISTTNYLAMVESLHRFNGRG